MADPNFSSVSLLLHCNGSDASTTFTDSSSVGHTVTAVGNAQIDTGQSKYGGASAQFDGTGDYLTVPDHASLNLTTGNLTIECWVRMNSIAANKVILAKASGTGTCQYRIAFDAGNNWFSFEANNAANNDQLILVYEGTVSTGVWYHIAVVRNANQWTIYQDGVAGDSLSWANTLFSTSQSVSIGGNNNGNGSLNGWIDDLRITKGVARYTAGFTPPAAQFEEADATGSISTATLLGAPALRGYVSQLEEAYFQNVSLLLHCDGTDGSTTFTDHSSTAKTVTASGNAQVDTAQAKFGGASALFDGTGDYLTVPHSTDLVLTTGDWTVECWVRLNSTAANAIIMQRAVGTGVYPWQLWFESSSLKFGFRGINGAATVAYALQSGAVSTGVWYHLAGVRDGNTMRFFVDGVAQGTATLASTLAITSSTSLSIGAANDGSAPLNGWVDDVRITKGTARYTAAFTPPAAAFPNGNNIIGYVSAAAILGAPALRGGTAVTGSVACATLLGSPRMQGGLSVGSIKVAALLGAPRLFGALAAGRVAVPAILGGNAGVYVHAKHDFSAAVTNRPTTYRMDLLLPDNTLVRVPISSWQGTQQTDNASYLACVVPACGAWVDAIEAATHFIINRSVTLDDGLVVEAEMARAPLENVQFDEGPENDTASLSGYSEPYAANADPPASFDRALTGVRSVSVYASGMRVRCAIDWLLRPSQRALYGGTSFVVSYINYYVSANASSVEEYMDIGERVAGA